MSTVGTIETKTEDEERHLILRMDRALLAQLIPERIKQGYFETGRDDVSLRIRISDDHHATRVRKEGIGRLRRETTEHISLEDGLRELARCPHRFRKRRYRVTNGWEIDVLEDELDGIILAEWERPDGYEGPTPSLPYWITESVDVTDRLTNYHLARLATELKLMRTSATSAVQELLAPRIPMIVLTGGPCAGKTSLMEELRRREPNRIHFVPEVATILIAQVGGIPNTRSAHGQLAFQRAVRNTQLIFEDVAQHAAHAKEAHLIIGDRGTLDSSAYLGDGLAEYERMSGQPIDRDLQRYHAVVHLRIPNRGVYEANMANNPARSEGYETAAALDRRIAEAWRGHARYLPIDNAGGWSQKLARAVKVVSDFLPNSGPIR